MKSEKTITKALTFDDVLVVPAHSLVLPSEVSTETYITKDIKLNIPFVSRSPTVLPLRCPWQQKQKGY